MVTPEQCRAARAWLGWNQEELANRTSVSVSSIRDFENGKRTPFANNMSAIARALSDAGIEMISDDEGKAAGIRFQKPAG